MMMCQRQPSNEDAMDANNVEELYGAYLSVPLEGNLKAKRTKVMGSPC
jgi:hypothetical protein